MISKKIPDIQIKCGKLEYHANQILLCSSMLRTIPMLSDGPHKALYPSQLKYNNRKEYMGGTYTDAAIFWHFYYMQVVDNPILKEEKSECK